MIRNALHKHARATIAASITTLLVAGGLAWAGIPGTDGTIHGCYNNKTGTLRVIDPAATSCGDKESAISWNQTGPPGADGTNGTNGDDGQDGDSLVGSTCSLPDGTEGTVAMDVASNGAISFTCEVPDDGTNDAPQLEPAGGGTASFTEGGSATEIAPTMTVADDDDTTLPSGTVTVVGFATGDGDVLSLPSAFNHGDITGTFNAGALTLTSASGNATKLEWQNALQDVTYSNTSDSPPASRTVRFQVSDGDAASNQVDYTVNITAVNDAPLLQPAGGGVATYTEGGSPTVIAPTMTLTDPDDTGLPSGTVRIVTAHPGDVLSFTPDASTGDITGTFDDTTDVLTLVSSSGTATKFQWQEALRNVTYSNTNADTTNTSRTIRFQVSDGEALSNAVDYTVNIASAA